MEIIRDTWHNVRPDHAEEGERSGIYVVPCSICRDSAVHPYGSAFFDVQYYCDGQYPVDYEFVCDACIAGGAEGIRKTLRERAEGLRREAECLEHDAEHAHVPEDAQCIAQEAERRKVEEWRKRHPGVPYGFPF